MPTAAPQDDASERALRASTVGPTLSFALLGLVTVLAVGLLGLSQQASVARDRDLAGTALAGPSLGALGSSAGDRAAAPVRPEPMRPVATGLVTSWSATPVVSPPEVPKGAAVSVGGGSGLAADLPGEGTSSGPVDEPAAGPADPGRRPAAKKPAAKKPAAKKVAAKKPAAKKVAAKKPAAKKVAARRPAAKKPVAKKPAVQKLAVHKPEPGTHHDARRGANHRTRHEGTRGPQHGKKHGEKHGPSRLV